MKCSAVRQLKAILHESEYWGFVFTVVPRACMQPVTGMYWTEEDCYDSIALSSAKSI